MSVSATTPPPASTSTASALRHDLRARAQAVLASLQAARAECDRQLALLRRPDAMKQVTGKSSLDEAINRTKRLIAELDEASEFSARAQPACEIEVRMNTPGFTGARQHQTAAA